MCWKNSVIAYNACCVLKSRVSNVSMFLHTIRISHALFFALAIWSAIAFNATERLKSIHPFTTKRTGKLDLTSTAYQPRRFNSLQGDTSSAQEQIRNLNYSVLSSEISTVTGAATSSPSRSSAVKPKPVLTRRSVGGSSAFHKVNIC